MAAIQFSKIIILAMMLAALANSSSATEYVVGDGYGWTLNFDYQSWAEGKDFYVGDKLVFNYPAGKHNVLKVNGTGFQQCDASPVLNEALRSGNDVITLLMPGRKWYICGVANHCEGGKMKLAITVLPQQMSPAPSPLPVSGGARTTLAAPSFYGFIAMIFGTLLIDGLGLVLL